MARKSAFDLKVLVLYIAAIYALKQHLLNFCDGGVGNDARIEQMYFYLCWTPLLVQLCRTSCCRKITDRRFRIVCRYKGKTYRATVETVRSSGEVGAFCRSICEKLECCPNLFGPTSFGENSCPDNCSGLTKTKYSK